MTAVDIPLLAKTPQMRPLNIMRDLSSVADLVEKCFADTMDAEGHNYLQQMRRAGQDHSFLRWAGHAVETVSMPLSGYVWEESGEIIGNVSLIPYHHARKKIYLIANVAVRADHRKRGIGRALTAAAMEHARVRHSDETWLHVRDDNPGAINIYRSLGFVAITRRTTWQAQPDRPVTGTYPAHEALEPGITITKRAARDWDAQESWLRTQYPDLLSWYQPMPWMSLRPGLIPILYRFLSEFEVRHWVIRRNDTPQAVLSWMAGLGSANRLWIAIPPTGGEVLLTQLLLHVRRALVWRERTSLDFPAGQYAGSIEAAGFHPHRTLVWMKSDETSTEETRKSI